MIFSFFNVSHGAMISCFHWKKSTKTLRRQSKKLNSRRRTSWFIKTTTARSVQAMNWIKHDLNEAASLFLSLSRFLICSINLVKIMAKTWNTNQHHICRIVDDVPCVAESCSCYTNNSTTLENLWKQSIQ